MRVAAGIVPAAVPAILGEDREAGCFAMAYLGADDTRCGRRCSPAAASIAATAAQVGDTLGRIHAATADRPDIAARFPTDAIFYAIRLEPYLVATARAHPDSRRASPRWSPRRQMNKRVLVHGDFSPKNILIGPGGAGDPRRRMRVVRRSGVRSRVRAQSPAAEGRVAARVARALRATRSRRSPAPICAHVAWEARGRARSAHGAPAARR